MSHDLIAKSKLLSLVLRHRPELIGIALDQAGWTPVVDLLAALGRIGEPMSLTELKSIVAGSDKQRFAFSADGTLIRANQGHSVSVDLGLAPAKPPDILFHGTGRRVLARIMREGLLRGKRHHVHLHSEQEVAATVGRRKGNAVVLSIDSAAMHRDGVVFYRSANDVWLTEAVRPKYLIGVGDDRATG